MSNYTELHLHDHFSALDGLNTAEEYMVRAKELGMTHLAETNHGTLAGHRQFQLAAKAAGITPILGLEAYYSTTDRFDKRTKANRQDGTNIYNHIIILAQNERGLTNLNAISEKAWIEGFYNKPRTDFELLTQYKDDLIILSGCMSGPISKALEAGDMELALKRAAEFKSTFGDKFYIEIQCENPVELNQGLLSVADKLKIKPVLTGDCHYANPKDRWLEEAFLILSTNPKLDRSFEMAKAQKMEMLERFNYMYPDRRMTFEHFDLFLSGREHRSDKLKAMGIDREDVFDNTNEIAARIGDYPFHSGLDLLPTPPSKNPKDYLRTKCREGMKKRGLEDKPEYEARLKEELKIIGDKKFDSYFLIEANVLQWGKKQGIMFGPGRGSGAGSLVNFVLGITDVDPLIYQLPFWRFVDPGRDDFPDIDTDVQDTRRGEIKTYMEKKFKNVAKIATFTTFDGKSVVKAAARVFAIPFDEINKVTKSIIDYDDYLKSPATADFRTKYPEVEKLAEKLLGRIAGKGMHAGGLVVSKKPIFNYVPVETATDKTDEVSGRTPIVALDMNDAADIGFIKYDFLGLKTLSVLGDTIKMIKERTGEDIVLIDLPLDDPKTYQMISDGYNKGVFQAEGHTFNKWLIETGADNFNDLVIGTSIARPGPLNTVGEIYKARKAGKESVTYSHEVMRKYTEETLGTIVYQEQLMYALIELGGMSVTDAHKVRKIIGKKRDVKEFEPFKIKFMEGATRFITEKEAEKLWHDFEAFAGYAFVKAHAVAYSMLTYWTAWLKCHYGLEFMTATLRNEKNKESITEYLMEAKRLGITIKLPHVNKSGLGFVIEDESIRMGLTGIKFISDNIANRIIAVRPFNSYNHLQTIAGTTGSGINSRAVAALNYVGAAVFDDNPRRKDHRDYFYEYLNIPAFTQADLPPRVKAQFVNLEDYTDKGAFLVMGMAKSIVRKPGWARVDLLDETGSAGIFADENTAIETGQMYAMLVADNRIARYMSMAELTGDTYNVLSEYIFADAFPDIPEGMYKVISFRKYVTKAGKKMAYVIFSDGEKELVSTMAFPTMYSQAFAKCVEGRVLTVDFGKTDTGGLFIKTLD